jgi:aspartate dehydrogenase
VTARVTVIGAGAIGRPVIAALAAGAVENAVLQAVVNDVPVTDCPVPQLALADALTSTDVVVECAGQEVVARRGAAILSAGCDLLVTSVGALADPAVAAALRGAGPGRMLITPGAIGGIDLLVSAAAHGPVRAASVTTHKLPRALLQPWMDEATQRRISSTTEPFEVFQGSASEAARLFPRSLNVATTVGLAIGDLEKVAVRLIADPGAELTSHIIEADGEAGRYRFEIRNRPSASNPRTSGIVPHAVLRTLSVLVGSPTGIV